MKLFSKEKDLFLKIVNKEVCTIDKLEYEGKEIEKEVEESCKNFYIIDKQDTKDFNNRNRNNFLISLATTIVLIGVMIILNKKL